MGGGTDAAIKVEDDDDIDGLKYGCCDCGGDDDDCRRLLPPPFNCCALCSICDDGIVGCIDREGYRRRS